MSKELIHQFISKNRLAVLSTVANDHKPESALVGIAVTDGLELIFDTVNTSRKYKNILQNPYISGVIGWDGEVTVQYEGIAIELTGKEDDRFKEIYFAAFPDGRNRAATWPGLVHFKVLPKWIRYSDFNEPVKIFELNL